MDEKYSEEKKSVGKYSESENPTEDFMKNFRERCRKKLGANSQEDSKVEEVSELVKSDLKEFEHRLPEKNARYDSFLEVVDKYSENDSLNVDVIPTLLSWFRTHTDPSGGLQDVQKSIERYGDDRLLGAISKYSPEIQGKVLSTSCPNIHNNLKDETFENFVNLLGDERTINFVNRYVERDDTSPRDYGNFMNRIINFAGIERYNSNPEDFFQGLKEIEETLNSEGQEAAGKLALKYQEKSRSKL